MDLEIYKIEMLLQLETLLNLARFIEPNTQGVLFIELYTDYFENADVHSHALFIQIRN